MGEQRAAKSSCILHRREWAQNCKFIVHACGRKLAFDAGATINQPPDFESRIFDTLQSVYNIQT